MRLKSPELVGEFFSLSARSRLRIYKGQYSSNGALSIMLMRINPEFGEETAYAVLSVNLDHGQPCTQSHELPENCFYAKDWSENIKVAREAAASGWFDIREDLPKGSSGFIVAPVWELRKEKRNAKE